MAVIALHGPHHLSYTSRTAHCDVELMGCSDHVVGCPMKAAECSEDEKVQAVSQRAMGRVDHITK